jgi:hypothetical protein
MTFHYSIYLSLEQIEDVLGVTLNEKELFSSDDLAQVVDAFAKIKDEFEDKKDADNYRFTVSFYLFDEDDTADIDRTTPFAADERSVAAAEYERLANLLGKQGE